MSAAAAVFFDAEVPPAAETACVFPLRHGMCGEGFSDLMCSLRRVIQKNITHDFYDTKAFFSAVADTQNFASPVEPVFSPVAYSYWRTSLLVFESPNSDVPFRVV